MIYRESDSDDESEVEASDAMAPIMADLNGLDSAEVSEGIDNESESADDDSGVEED